VVTCSWLAYTVSTGLMNAYLAFINKLGYAPDRVMESKGLILAGPKKGRNEK
jgi:hypothetical protein